MNTRTVSQAAGELAALRRVTFQQAAVALAATLVAAPAGLVDSSLALAFGAGAAFEAMLALTTWARRGALIASLAVHREAYLVPEVQRYGTALATMKRRRALAHLITSTLRGASGLHPGVVLVDRVTWQAPALAALAHALIDPENVVEPTAMAACLQLLTDGQASPLLNPVLPRTELERVLRSIHTGISRRHQPGASVSVEDRSQAA